MIKAQKPNPAHVSPSPVSATSAAKCGRLGGTIANSPTGEKTIKIPPKQKASGKLAGPLRKAPGHSPMHTRSQAEIDRPFVWACGTAFGRPVGCPQLLSLGVLKVFNRQATRNRPSRKGRATPKQLPTPPLVRAVRAQLLQHVCYALHLPPRRPRPVLYVLPLQEQANLLSRCRYCFPLVECGVHGIVGHLSRLRVPPGAPVSIRYLRGRDANSVCLVFCSLSYWELWSCWLR